MLQLFKFKPYYFIAFIALLLLEISIAIQLKTGFIRHTVGDFLVTILIYCCIKSLANLKPFTIGLIVLLIAFSVEFLQLFNLLDFLNLRDNKLATIILGTSFSIQDLVAYFLGILCIVSIDLLTTKNNATLCH